MNATLTNRGLLRAVLLAFALFLAYRFLATVAVILLLLAAACSSPSSCQRPSRPCTGAGSPDL